MDADELLASFSTIAVDDVRLPDLDVYRHLKDRHLKCREGLFVAEGSEVVRRLLRSRFAVHSLLVTPEKLARLRDDVPAQVPVYVASVAQMEQVAGFAIHRGAVACGHRQPRRSLDAVLAEVVDPRLVVVLEGVCDAQNVGLMVRNAAAFGADLVITSGCCDPFYRRAVRVSMGNVFRVPICESEYVLGDLRALRDRYGMTLVAAELSDEAISLHQAVKPPRVALLFGSEGAGLSPAVLEICDQRVIVPVHPESDSVNVAVAGGIFLHAFAPR